MAAVVDIATLGLGVDATQVEAGAAALDNLTVKAAAAEEAARSFGSGFDASSSSLNKLVNDANRMDESIRNLGAGFTGLRAFGDKPLVPPVPNPIPPELPERVELTHRQMRVLAYTALAGAVLLSACSTTKELVVLLPGEDGQVGAVAIAEPQRTTLLDTPLGAAKIDARGHVKKDTLSAADVKRTFAEALAAQPPKALSFSLYFLQKSTEVTPDSRATLDALLAEVAKRQAVEVQITGHTDRVGKVEDNDRLSMQRAEAIRDVLIKNGLHASFIRAVGRGEREPLIPTPDEQAEPRNRRVEVIVR